MFKLNISDKTGKTYKLEIESPALIDKELNQTVKGLEISPDLEGYELEITGASDKSGFTAMKDVPGNILRKELLTYGKGMKKRPKKEGKRERSNKNPKGLRLRKTVRGRAISENITQINMKVTKQGSKKLEEVFAKGSAEKTE